MIIVLNLMDECPRLLLFLEYPLASTENILCQPPSVCQTGMAVSGSWMGLTSGPLERLCQGECLKIPPSFDWCL